MPTDALQLHTSTGPKFSGYSKDFDKSRYVVLGVPYDRTSTYRSGSRFGPAAIREASLNIETYSLRSKVDIEDVAISDVGDLNVVDSMDETLRRLSDVVRDITNAGKLPIALGGEHTVTLGMVRALRDKSLGVINFDAHGDLRDEYSGEKLNHATVMRRISEIVGPQNLVLVGIRALCKEEVQYMKSHKVKNYQSSEILGERYERVAAKIASTVSRFKRLYVTIDIDVFDPAFAPGVGNPEADGLDPSSVLAVLSRICDSRIVGLDLVEVSPNYDTGITAALASRLLFEAIAAIESNRLV